MTSSFILPALRYPGILACCGQVGIGMHNPMHIICCSSHMSCCCWEVCVSLAHGPGSCQEGEAGNLEVGPDNVPVHRIHDPRSMNLDPLSVSIVTFFDRAADLRLFVKTRCIAICRAVTKCRRYLKGGCAHISAKKRKKLEVSPGSVS